MPSLQLVAREYLEGVGRTPAKSWAYRNRESSSVDPRFGSANSAHGADLCSWNHPCLLYRSHSRPRNHLLQRPEVCAEAKGEI